MNKYIAALSLLLIVCGQSAADVARIFSDTGVHGGFVVHLGCGDGTVTAGLGAEPGYVVQGLDADASAVARARDHIRTKGLQGRVTADTFDGRTLPYLDNLVTLVVADATDVPMAEIMRVLRPLGVAYVGGKVRVKPWPADIDEWTHYLHNADNNAVAGDKRIGPPRHMQWLSDPLWTRHHDKLASVSTVVTARGRLFYIVDEGPVYDPQYPSRWSVTARDAFNGVFLWKTPIASWTSHKRKFRSGPVQLQRLLVTDGDRVYVTLGLDEPISVLSAATGERLATLAGTEKTEEMVLQAGTLVVQIGTQGSEQGMIERVNAKGLNYKGTKIIKAVDCRSGATLWRWPLAETAEIMPRTLTVSGGDVFCQEKGQTVCLTLRDGKVRWRYGAPPKAAAAGKKKGKKGAGRSLGWTYATVVAHDGVVLSCDNRTLHAVDAASGKQLWECAAQTPFGRTPSVDILVVNGVVWTSPSFGAGRVLRTGETVSRNALQQELVTAGHHHRCYRNKATERYVIQGHRGLEFRDTVGENHVRHNWIRGLCQYGIMPANGFVHLPPHNCGCYPEAKLFGFWTLGATQSTIDPDSLSPSTMLEKGPAFGTASGARSAAGDWPMHRHDAARSGITAAALPAALETAWRIPLGGRLTAPVVGGGTVLVASVDTHDVFAFDAASGKPRWRFTAGAAVDSPPTIHGNTALFGSADGHVYCLTLADGKLVWCFRAAPLDRRTVALQHVESLWPVHGSVLLADGTAYVTAGRSSYLDGGIFMYGLDPLTGAVTYSSRLDSKPARALKNEASVPAKGFAQNKVDYKTSLGPDRSDAFSMDEGNISDIMVADGTALYLRHMKFGMDLTRQAEWTHHLFSTSRLIDDNEAHRSHWFFGKGDFSRLPVAYEWMTRGSYGGFQSPFGKFFVYDGKTLWGTNDRRGHSLFTCDITDADRTIEKDFPHDKSSTRVHPKPLIASLDIHPRALIKAGADLLLAGFPLDTAVTHQYGKRIGGVGALLRVSSVSGTEVTRYDLPSPPVFDGMSAAGGGLYISCEDGSVVCLR